MSRNKDWKNKKKQKDEEDDDSMSKRRGRSSRSEGVGHKFNDVSWYAKNTQMLNDAASYSYNNALGSSVDWTQISSATANSYLQGRAIPGLMVHNVMICPGKSLNSASPANIAGQNIYSYVRYMNSGAKNYDQQDMLMYLMSMDSIFACWNWMKRIYGYLRTYSQYNRYMPKVYAQADFVSFDDLSSNLADFRLYLNQAAAKISAFCVPAVMPLFVRHSWMFSNIYADSNLLKAQQYMFKPAGFYILNEVAQTGTQLKWQPLTTEGMTFIQLQTYLNAMIDAMAYSEDVGIMSGDILKAYGEAKLFKLSAVDPDYQVMPVYNEEVLNQMHNSTAYPLFNASDTSNNITQNPDLGYLVWNPKFSASAPLHTHRMINMPWDSVTPANTMVGTRLTYVLQQALDNSIRIAACGSEVIVGRAIYAINYSDSTNVTIPRISFNSTVIDFTADNGETTLTYIAFMSQFDWHPLYELTFTAGTASSLCGLLGDISNYTVLSADDLDKLHYTAIMSEFNIPQLGSF